MRDQEWKRIPPVDPSNYAGIYYKREDGCVAIAGEAFGEINTEHMIFMEEHQFEVLRQAP